MDELKSRLHDSGGGTNTNETADTGDDVDGSVVQSENSKKAKNSQDLGFIDNILNAKPEVSIDNILNAKP
ncbi:MAG: hypothetical protein CMB97_01780 [Flavobacteriaceae bacterium]|nr:hypothetical protein [Flavobacteriaceae bacterium]